MMLNDPAAGGARSLSVPEFAHAMARFGPFERAPHVAVAVSGGRDSMALCLLAHRWAQAMGGRITALTVDHRLRSESAREALQVGAWLAGCGIAHDTLVWNEPKPVTGVQAAARTARYELMQTWCRDRGVLHMLLGHHREDQAETVLLRLQRDSGLDGLAGMSAIVEHPDVRFLRPLLEVPRRRLEATLHEHDQPWLDDPSNADPAYARTRLRDVMRTAGTGALSVDNLTGLAGRCARARTVLENDAAALLARWCSLDPAGFARLDVAGLRQAEDEISVRALARVVRCVGGRAFAPRLERLEAVHAAFKENRLGGGRTVGNCRVLIERDHVLVCREARNLPAPAEVSAGRPVLWDNRFIIEAGPSAAAACGALTVMPLGEAGWGDMVREQPDARAQGLPAPVRAALPAFYDKQGMAFVPHAGFLRENLVMFGPGLGKARFRPLNALGDRGFVGFMLHP